MSAQVRLLKWSPNRIDMWQGRKEYLFVLHDSTILLIRFRGFCHYLLWAKALHLLLVWFDATSHWNSMKYTRWRQHATLRPSSCEGWRSDVSGTCKMNCETKCRLFSVFFLSLSEQGVCGNQHIHYWSLLSTPSSPHYYMQIMEASPACF